MGTDAKGRTRRSSSSAFVSMVIATALSVASVSIAFAEVYKDPTGSVAVGTASNDNAMGSLVGVSAGWGYGGLVGVGATNGATGSGGAAVGNGGFYTWGEYVAVGTSIFTCSDGVAVGTQYACGYLASIGPGRAEGYWLSLGGGDAGTTYCQAVAISLTGTSCGLVSISGTGPASGDYWGDSVQISGMGPALGGLVNVSGMGAAYGNAPGNGVSVSGTGPTGGMASAGGGRSDARYAGVSATGDATAYEGIAIAPNGNVYGSLVAVSSGDATTAAGGLLCISVTGDCRGNARLGLAPLGTSS